MTTTTNAMPTQYNWSTTSNAGTRRKTSGSKQDQDERSEPVADAGDIRKRDERLRSADGQPECIRRQAHVGHQQRRLHGRLHEQPIAVIRHVVLIAGITCREPRTGEVIECE
jgi:hypothetical protein